MMQEPQAEYELDLAKKIVDVSNVLATRLHPEKLVAMPDEQLYLGTWHVEGPNFSRPEVQIDGHDMSDVLYDLGQRTNELVVEMKFWNDRPDLEFGIVPTHYWSTFPASKYSECLLLDIICPIELSDVSPEAFKKIRELGTLKLQDGSWFTRKEPDLNFSKKETSMLYLLGNNPLTELYMIHWYLEGLSKSESVLKVDVGPHGNII